MPYYIDVGAGDSESTWQANAGVGYQARDTLDVMPVYRHMEWDLDSTRVIDDILCLAGVKLYQLTESGLALQATIQGTRYLNDDDLN